MQLSTLSRPFRRLAPLLALAAIPAGAVAQQLVHDDFDRPDSTDLGPDWFEANGDHVIQSLQAKGNVAFVNDTWMHHTQFAQPYASAKARVEFRRNPIDSLFAAGLVIGLDPSTWGGVAVLVQDNDLDGQFDRIFFNAAINAGAWFSQPTPVHYDFPAPLTAGELTIWTQDGGDLAVARVEDGAGNLVGVYTAGGIVGSPFAPTGTRAAIWSRSRPFYDDFYALERRALDAYPTSVSVAVGGTQTLDVTLESAHAGELYFLAGSTITATPGIPIGGGVTVPLGLDPVLTWMLAHPNTAPYQDTFGTLDAVGHARARLALPPGSSPSLAGLTIHHAAVSLDPATLVPTAVTNTASVDLLP